MENIVTALHQLIHDLVPDAPTIVRFGGTAYLLGHTPVVAVFRRLDHVALEITGGVNLHDTYGVLEGDGRDRRHIALYDLADIDDKHVAEYVQAAFAFHS